MEDHDKRLTSPKTEVPSRLERWGTPSCPEYWLYQRSRHVWADRLVPRVPSSLIVENTQGRVQPLYTTYPAPAPPGLLFRVLMTCKNWCWPHQRTPYDYKRVLDKAVPQINLSSLGVVVSNTLLKVKAWIVKDCMDFKIGWQRAQTAHLLSSSHWHHHQA